MGESPTHAGTGNERTQTLAALTALAKCQAQRMVASHSLVH
jgi:hypothetical protein